MTNATGNVEQELKDATKLHRRIQESEQVFLNRLCDSGRALSDDAWEGLSTEAQVWVNVATTSQNDKTPLVPPSKPLDDPSSDIEETEEEDTAETDSEDEASTESTEEQSPEPPKAAKSDNGNGKRPKQAYSASRYVKLLIARDPKIDLDGIRAKLDEMELHLSDLSLATIASDMRTTLKVLNEAGLIHVNI